MSQLEVDKIIPQSGTTLTIGDSGDTVNFADGTNLSIDTNTLFIDSTNNRVGIANNSPSETLEVSGNIKLGDNNKIKFGTGNDLEIYHDGSNSYVSEVGSGNLFVNTNGTKIALISDLSSSNGKMAEFTKDGAVELYYDNNKKFETTSTGATVTGKFNVSSDIADFAIKSENTTHNARVDIIASGSNKNSILNFGDGASSTVGFIDYDHADNSLRFATSATERARIDASGNLLVGKSSADTSTSGVEFRSDGLVGASRASNPPLIVNRRTDDGDVILIRKDNTTLGRLSVTSTPGFAIGTPNGNGSGLHLISNAILPSTSSGGTADNLHDLGASSSRYKDIYLGGEGKFSKARSNTLGQSAIKILPSDTVVGYGFRLEQTNNDLVVEKSAPSGSELEIARFKVGGGIALGGTGTANTLDDYEEGTFTPSISGNLGSGSGVNFSIRNAFYTKVGRAVFFNIHISLSSWSSGPSGSSTIITGLPFANENTTGNNASVYIGQCNNFSTSLAPQGGYIQPNETRIILMSNDSSDARNNLNTSIHTNTLTGNEEIRISGYYHTA